MQWRWHCGCPGRVGADVLCGDGTADAGSIELKVHPSSTLEDMADVIAAFRKVVTNIDELKNGGSNK